MSKIIPPNRPKITRAEIENIVAYHKAMFPHKFAETDFVVLVGIRGYFADSLGKIGVNDYNVYDDAIIAVSPRYYKTFNANCDPSFVKDPKDGTPLARLNLGVYPFYKGQHQSKYDAFRAYPNGVSLPCTRDGKPSVCSFINIHYGGETPSWYLTWSHGCQTIPKTQFVKEFQPEVYFELKKYAQKTVPYILIEKVSINGVEKFKAGNNQIIPDNFQPEAVEKLEAISAADTDDNSAIPMQTGDSSEDAGAQNQPPVKPVLPPNEQPVPAVIGGGAGENGTIVCKERPSSFVRLWTGIVAGVGAATSLGVNVQSLFEKASEAITARQIIFTAFGLAVIALALWFYDRSANRATRLNQQKMDNASNPNRINVEIQGQG